MGLDPRPRSVLVIGPGASFSTADVEAGLVYGLDAHGVRVVNFALDSRLEGSRSWLNARYRLAHRAGWLVDGQPIQPASHADVAYHAALGALERALGRQVDAVVVVSGLLFHPRVIQLLQRAGFPVALLMTESPYEAERERSLARLVNHVWTNERTSIAAYRDACPSVRYLPHAYHPERHRPGVWPGDELVPAHDVVFVGTGFPERIAFFESIDWSGIDLGLYGHWRPHLPRRSRLRRYVKGDDTPNPIAAALYRRAKVGINLYRTMGAFSAGGFTAPAIPTGVAESCSPRAYELAACGVCHISDYRREVADLFGDLVPTFTTPADAEALVRALLADDARRQSIAGELPRRVSWDSWVQRAEQVITDLTALRAGRLAERREPVAI